MSHSYTATDKNVTTFCLKTNSSKKEELGSWTGLSQTNVLKYHLPPFCLKHLKVKRIKSSRDFHHDIIIPPPLPWLYVKQVFVAIRNDGGGWQSKSCSGQLWLYPLKLRQKMHIKTQNPFPFTPKQPHACL